MIKRNRHWPRTLENLSLIGLAIFFSFLLGAIILFIAGQNPLVVYAQFFRGIFARPQFVAWGLIYATPMIFTGLSVAIAFKAGMFNIGADGQFIVGTIAAVAVGIFFDLSPIIHVPLALLTAAFAGGLWSSIAGYLKVYHSVHEVVVTIMLNWVALYLCNFFTLSSAVVRPDSEVSRDIAHSASLQFDFLASLLGRSTRVNWGMLIGLICVFILHHLIHKTTYGYKMRAVGFNADASRAAGMPMRWIQMMTMAISGALAGLGGAVQIMGVTKHTVVNSTSDGHGFDGIAVALIGMGEPIGVFFAALFYGSLKYGAGKLTAISTPGELVGIIIGLIVYFIAISAVLKYVMNNIKEKIHKKRSKKGVEK
ncbi:MAG: ABC transporter permease [Spirochaetia bacterium]